LFLVLSLHGVLGAAYTGIGDRLLHTYFSMTPMPLNSSDAVAKGWSADGPCNQNLGIRYSSGDSPLILYFTAGGQIAGNGMLRNDKPLPSLTPSFWKPTTVHDQYEITLSFRDASTGVMCQGFQAAEEIGNALIINQDSIKLHIALNNVSAAAQQWTSGGCIEKMGIHWFYDLQGHPNPTWKTANLVPIMPMYNQATGLLTAFLVQTDYVEDVWPFGWWEGPFIPSLFCYNFCPPCTFDTSVFSTIHFFLTDPELNLCSSHCPNSSESAEMPHK